ncbi:hypothetical protein ACLKA6_017342 [Drosophila palustris]
MAEVCITGAMNTTPSEALDAILNLPPIKQISAEISILAAIRLRDINLWNDHQIGHSSILLNRVDIPRKTDSCMPIEHLNTPFHILIPRREEWVIGPPGETGALSFYTDGSKLNSQDIPGNCIADELARRGTTNILLPDKEDISMPLASCKLLLLNQSMTKASTRWQNASVGRIARQAWPYIDKARTTALCRLSRNDCSMVVRSLTGHWLVGTHALRLNAPYNDFCRSCRDEEEEESTEHFFCFCPALSNRRLRTLGKPFLNDLSDLSYLTPRRIARFVQLSNWTPFKFTKSPRN